MANERFRLSYNATTPITSFAIVAAAATATTTPPPPLPATPPGSRSPLCSHLRRGNGSPATNKRSRTGATPAHSAWWMITRPPRRRLGRRETVGPERTRTRTTDTTTARETNRRGHGAGGSHGTGGRQDGVQRPRSAATGASISGSARASSSSAVVGDCSEDRFFLEGKARAVAGEAKLHLVLGEPVPFVPELVQVQALRVVAGQVAKEAVAVLRGAEARANGAPHEAEAIDGAYRRPGILWAAEGDVGARAAVPRVLGRNSVVVIDHQLRDLPVLREILRLCWRWWIAEGG